MAFEFGAAIGNVVNALKTSGVVEVAGTALSALVAKKMGPKIKKAVQVVEGAAPAAAPPAGDSQPRGPAAGVPAWVTPAAIGVGAVVLGVLVVGAMRRRG